MSGSAIAGGYTEPAGKQCSIFILHHAMLRYLLPAFVQHPSSESSVCMLMDELRSMLSCKQASPQFSCALLNM